MSRCPCCRGTTSQLQYAMPDGHFPWQLQRTRTACSGTTGACAAGWRRQRKLHGNALPCTLCCASRSRVMPGSMRRGSCARAAQARPRRLHAAHGHWMSLAAAARSAARSIAAVHECHSTPGWDSSMKHRIEGRSSHRKPGKSYPRGDLVPGAIWRSACMLWQPLRMQSISYGGCQSRHQLGRQGCGSMRCQAG